MTPEKANQIISKAGFTQYDVFAPSDDTRGLWVIRVKTTRGWKYLRIASDAGDPASQLAAWVATLAI